MQVKFDVDAALAKLGQLAQAHGQEAINAAVQVKQVDSINHLIGIPGWGAVLVACGFAAYGIRKWWGRFDAADDFDTRDFGKLSCGIAGLILALGTALSAFAFICALFGVWAWVGLFNPKLALAHDILVKLVG